MKFHLNSFHNVIKYVKYRHKQFYAIGIYFCTQTYSIQMISRNAGENENR